MEKIKVGIIGSGFIVEYYCYSYEMNPHAEIVGMSSLHDEEAKKFNEFSSNLE